jgi:predicted transposase YbfD/YdcC
MELPGADRLHGVLSRKQPTVTMHHALLVPDLPPLAQHGEQICREHGIAIPATLATLEGIQLKDNQPSLLQNAEAVCASRNPTSSDTEVTTGRGRHETRTAEVFSANTAVAGTEWKPLIKAIVRVTRDVLHRDAKTGLWSSTAEIAYYLANSPISARHAATAIRCHWHVENSLHYTRDVTFQEDQSRIRYNPGVFARLRSFAYNILRRNQTSTFNQDRYAAALCGVNALLKWNFS